MDVKELKESIENKTLDDSIIVMVGGSDFLKDQYIKGIADSRSAEIEYVAALDKNTMFDSPSLIKVLKIDTAPVIENKDDYKNYIISCKKSSFKESIKMPELKDWQIVDYIKEKVPGVHESDIGWLVSALHSDLYRIDMEASKLSIFPESSQQSEFERLKNSGELNDVNNINLFDLPNAISARDLIKIRNHLKEFIDKGIEPLRLCSLLINQFYCILNIQCSPAATPESLNISANQFGVFKRYYTDKFSDQQLATIYKKLNLIDYELRSGKIDEHNLIDYMIVNIFAA